MSHLLQTIGCARKYMDRQTERRTDRHRHDFLNRLDIAYIRVSKSSPIRLTHDGWEEVKDAKEIESEGTSQ